MIELRLFRLELRQRLPLRALYTSAAGKKLQMVTVRTHHRLGEPGRLITVRPVKRRLQDDLLCRITLRFVKTRCRLGLAKDVRDPVVADAVARTKIRMRVVIERAPSDPARILWVRCQLIMDSGMPQGVFPLPLIIVSRLGRKRMTDELCIQIERMVRLLQRKAKVVHGENVLQKLGPLEVPYPARLPRRIQRVC